jgi:ribosomal protein S18 acetylase RimI-like enzyme
MGVEIRKAGIEDLDSLMSWRMEVLHAVFEVPEDQPLTRLEQSNRAYYEQALSNGEHIACFALVDDEIAGCGGICLQREMPSPDNPSGLCGYLMNVYTRPQFRQRGIGAAIVSWLVEQGRQAGAEKIYLETTEAGRPLYEKLGFRDMPDYLKLETRKNEDAR